MARGRSQTRRRAAQRQMRRVAGHRPAAPTADSGDARAARRAVMVLVVLAVLAVLAVVAVLATRSPTGSHDASRLPATVQVSSYRVVYDVTLPGAPGSREENDVSRPYTGRQVTRDAKGALQSGTLTTPSATYIYVNGSGVKGWARVGNAPARAVGDQHALGAMRAAVQQGLADIRGTRTVLGRRCTLVRTGSPIGQPMKKATSKEYADLCVDRTGVVLSQDWRLNGQPTLSRRAVEFTPNATFASATFQPKPAATGAAVDQLAQGSPVATKIDPGKLATLPVRFDPPTGYSLSTAEITALTLQGRVTASTVVHYVNGSGDLLSLTIGSGPGSLDGRQVELPGGRRGRLQPDLVASRLTLRFGDYFAQLEDGDPALLTQASRGLHQQGKA